VLLLHPQSRRRSYLLLTNTKTTAYENKQEKIWKVREKVVIFALPKGKRSLKDWKLEVVKRGNKLFPKKSRRKLAG